MASDGRLHPVGKVNSIFSFLKNNQHSIATSLRTTRRTPLLVFLGVCFLAKGKDKGDDLAWPSKSPSCSSSCCSGETSPAYLSRHGWQIPHVADDGPAGHYSQEVAHYSVLAAVPEGVTELGVILQTRGQSQATPAAKVTVSNIPSRTLQQGC